jgi:menaquinone-dependent protoporphyrinogen IX oxidase
MEKLIICPKAKGNTYNVCRYVADHSDVALKVASADNQFDIINYDSIVLASGIYGGFFHKNVLNWIKTIKKSDLKESAKIYIFLTWIGRGNSDKVAYNKIRKLLNEKSITLQENYMECYGHGLGVAKIGHPSKDDFENVLLWVNKL